MLPFALTGISLDTLFEKTTTAPALYYLPVPASVVEARRAENARRGGPLIIPDPGEVRTVPLQHTGASEPVSGWGGGGPIAQAPRRSYEPVPQRRDTYGQRDGFAGRDRDGFAGRDRDGFAGRDRDRDRGFGGR